MADPWDTLSPTAWTRAAMSHPLGAAVYNAYQQGDRAGILGLVPDNVRRAWSPWLLPLANPAVFMDTLSPGAAVRDTLHASGDLARAAMRGDPVGALGATGMGLLSIAGLVPWLAPVKAATAPTQGAARAAVPVAATEGRGTAKPLMPDLMPLVPQPAFVQNSSRSVNIYDPPQLPQRAFSEDYKKGVPGGVPGQRLTRDIEGRPLTADRVVGRKVVGGDDVALPPTELDALGTSITGRRPASVAPSELRRGVVGRYFEYPDPVTRERIRAIALSRALPADKARLVLGHEIGHALDEAAGQISSKGVLRELGRVYNDLNNPSVWRGADAGRNRPTPTYQWERPEHSGYRGEAVHRELMAEAIRAYLADPNYLKTVAPKTAARIRDHVNSHPYISRSLQFNSLAAPLAGAGTFGALMPFMEPGEEQP